MNVIINWLISLGLSEAAAVFCARVLAVVAMLGVACIAYIIAKRLLLRIVKRLVERSKTIWDEKPVTTVSTKGHICTGLFG